jgi:hypothetical protein
MKLVIATVATVSGVLFALSMATANPSLLPKHEGYPMKNSGSPVTGQPTANDPGQCADYHRPGSESAPDRAGATDQDCPSGDLCHEDHRRSEDRVVEPFRWIQQGGAGPIRRPPLFLFVRSEWGS